MAQLLPNVYQHFYDANGIPLIGGKLYSYEAGTSWPLATYTDQGHATPNPNPVILDSAGGASVFITNAGYKFRLEDANGNVQFTVDQIYLIEPGAIGSNEIADGAVDTAQIADEAVTTAKIKAAAITTALIAPGAVTSESINDGAVTIDKLDPSIDLTQLQNMIELVFKRTDDLSGARLSAIPQYPWSNPIQQLNPGALPAAQANDAKYSPDGRFLAIAHNTTPFVTIYERSGSTFTKLPDPGTTPTGNANAVAWSPNGDFLAVAHATTPFVTIYQRQGNNFTKLSNPAALLGSAGQALVFSPNGEFLATCGGSTTGFKIYQILGTTFTDITGSSGIASPAGNQGFCAWSADSQYLALSNGTGAGNLLACYQRTGATFTAMTITVQPGASITCMTFTPDNAQLVGGFLSSPTNAFSYSISGSTLTGPANPFPSGSPPANTVLGISVSPNGALIAVVTQSTPFIQIYSGSFAGGWTLLSNPADLPTSQCNGVSWSPTNQWLAIACKLTPFVYNYRTAAALPAKGLFYSRNFADV